MRGIISGGSQQTVDAGAEMLQRGGNAIDAIVAASFVTFLSEPILSTPSGGGYALVTGPNQKPVLYDFFCNTPGLGEDRRTADMDFYPVTVQYESGSSDYHVGRASCAVPGNIAGLATMLEDLGKLPLHIVLEPAIRLCNEGFILNQKQSDLIKLVDVIFDQDPSCAPIFKPNGYYLLAGERLANPDLGATLEHIATCGWQSCYTGEIADVMLKDQRDNGGLLTTEDLATYRVIKRDPLTFTHNGATIYTNPPPSAGGILIAYMLRLFQQIGFDELVHNSSDHAALIAEIMQQTVIARFRNRPSTMQDAAAWTAWLSEAHQADDVAAIKAVLASGKARAGLQEPPSPTSTTHISVIDENGLAVGMTTSGGETAGYMFGNTGILANNMLGEQELSPDGFHVYKPGTRMASMMAPTVVVVTTTVGSPMALDIGGLSNHSDNDVISNGMGGLPTHSENNASLRSNIPRLSDSGESTEKNASPILVLGSGGAARLRSAIFHVMSNVLDWQMPLDKAVIAARVHFENNVLDLEGGFEPAEADAVEAKGYAVSRWPGRAFYFGGTHAAQRDASGAFIGAGDDRRDGAVAVVE